MREDASRPLAEYFVVIVKWRRLIIFHVLLVAVLAAILSLVLPKWYTSTASILPVEQTGADYGLMSFVESTFPRLSIPGVSAPSEAMLSILSSRRVAEEVIAENGLEEVWRSETIDNALRTLGSRTDLEVDANGAVIIRVEERTPERARDMVRSYVDALERYNTTIRQTSGRKTREFIDGRIVVAIEDLTAAEDSLAAFQEANTTFEIDEQARAAITALAEVEAEIARAEIELGILGSYATETHPEFMRLQTKLDEYRRAHAAMTTGSEIGGVAPEGSVLAPLNEMPAIALEYLRLKRDVEVLNRIYFFLVQELEAAKLQEAKDTPTVQVLDEPSLPILRSRPRRTVMVVIAAILGLILGVVVALVKEFLSSTDDSNPTRRSVDQVMAMLRRDLREMRARFRG